MNARSRGGASLMIFTQRARKAASRFAAASEVDEGRFCPRFGNGPHLSFIVRDHFDKLRDSLFPFQQ